MTTITVTIWIDDETHCAVIERLHPGQPYTPQQVMEFLVRMAIEELGTPATDPVEKEEKSITPPQAMGLVPGAAQ